METFSLITIGDCGVGKTSIIKRFVNNVFEEKTMLTIGLAFVHKEIILSNGKKILLKLVDTAGQEKYRALAKSYYKNSDGVLFVFSLEEKKSFDNLKNWIEAFNNYHNGKEGIPKLLVGNKCDLEEKINQNCIDDFLRENKDFSYVKTSAKDNISIDEAFQKIAENLYHNYEKEGIGKKGQKNFKINEKKKEKPKKNCFSKFFKKVVIV